MRTRRVLVCVVISFVLIFVINKTHWTFLPKKKTSVLSEKNNHLALF